MSESIKILVDGGAATAGPPLGPALGPLGVNAAKVVEEINKQTGDFKGMKIPVEVVVDPETKEFKVKVGMPPTSALILKALGVEKGGGGNEPVGDLGFMQLVEIVKKKQDSILAKDVKSALKEVAGTCQSLRVTIEGRKAGELIREINEGLFDDVIAGKSTEIPKPVIREEKKVKIIGVKEEKEEKPEEKVVEGEEKAGEKAGEAGEKPVEEKKDDK
jgi:large subunit ribosomal protein L11